VTSSGEFSPDWASPPGSTIADALNERGTPLSRALTALRITETEFTELVRGDRAIDADLAERISRLVGGGADFWLAREERYREGLATERNIWLSQLPLTDMVRMGWIRAGSTDDERVRHCLSFFGVREISEWRRKYGGRKELVRFRASARLPMRFGSIAAWLRKGELLAAQIKCEKWDPPRLASLLPEMRSLSKHKEPLRFLPRLSDLCSTSGIVLTVLRAPAGCPVSGMATFLSEDRAWVQLSFRYLSDDQFWFTFFHEIGHLLLHPNRSFLEGIEAETTREEREANQFSADLLVPPPRRPEMLEAATDYRKIVRFAMSLGISPGIVVGQLQHAGALTPRQKNFLKRRYIWSE